MAALQRTQKMPPLDSLTSRADRKPQSKEEFWARMAAITVMNGGRINGRKVN
jgi:hypothetical protein